MGAQIGRCYVDFADGACRDLLGEGVAEVDCCLNPHFGYRTQPDAPCQACGPAVWGAWSPWGACSVSCGEGAQRRQRMCQGREGCARGLRRQREVQACTPSPCCPVVGGWSPWSPWGPCSVTCESGEQRRTRTCTEPPPACGGVCPPGSSSESRPCRDPRPCPTHGSWGPWGPWGPCSTTCAPDGPGPRPSQHRQRLCNSPAPSQDPPGQACPGPSTQDQSCTNLPFCPVDGAWGAWTAAAPCPVTCGLGKVTQRRACDSPAPQHGGTPCSGPNTQTNICNTHQPCPVDGHWSEWSAWTRCSRPGFTSRINCQEIIGQQKRTRVCEGRAHNGQRCPGSTTQEIRFCYNMQLCSLPGAWSDWSPWGLCLPPCGPSPTRTRLRQCLPVLPKYPLVTQGVGGAGIVNITFWGRTLAACEPLQGQRLQLEEAVPCKHVPPCDEDAEEDEGILKPRSPGAYDPNEGAEDLDLGVAEP
ncbi:properdin [Alligator mississippiensis]|uniref:Properdin n=1 Tax=Alligator mississippiensis TaxID=8496 RepID=A0A151MYJ4_ALLMI|nr:properdin [Alligator mississippiensis]